jgi:hypothetical protein
MKEKTQEQTMDALNAGIAKSREEIAALAAGLNKLAEWKTDKSDIDGKGSRVPTNGNKHNGGWEDFRYKLDDVGARGQKVARSLADEIERHPLIGGMAAFGLGFVVAKWLFRSSNSKENTGQ